jgi:zinc protease
MLLAIAAFIAAIAPAQAQTEVRPPAALPSYKDLKFAPLPPLKIPEPQVFTLPNGMKIYMLEDHELPLVHGVAIVRTGNLFDPPDKRGVAELTGTVLRSGGTHNETGDDIDVQLENIAASVESGIGESSGTLTFSCLKENEAEVMQVFHDLMTAPEFRQDKVDLAKTQLRSAISRRNDDPSGIVSREFGNIVYGRDTPYGWNIEYEHVSRITRQDLVDFYRRYYFPSNIMLGIYGDFSSADMKVRLEKLFGDWNDSQPPVPKFPTVSAAPVPGVFMAEKGDVTQTFFTIGHLGGVLNDKDYPALEVAADILGGGFSSRLFQRVRTQLGYAYNIGSSWGANYDHPGLFQITGSTQSRYTVATIQAILEELRKLRSGEVTDEELKTAKDTVLNGFVFFFDRPSKTLNRVLIYAYYGYPRDFIFQYQKAVASVTKADILRVAQRYLKPEDLTVVAVANPKDFAKPITELGLKVQLIDLTIPEPPKAKPSPAVSDPQAAAQAQKLLARLREALGGAEKLSAVKDVEFTAEVEVQAPNGPMKGTQRNAYLLPSSLRQELDLPFAKQTVFSDGTKGWIAGPQGTQLMSPPIIKQVQGETFRQLYRLASSDHVSYAADDALSFDDGQGGSVKLTLDAKSGLPLKLSYETTGMTGPVEVDETFGDWRDVNGIKVPFERSITQNGKKFVDLRIRDYKINAGLTMEDLSKKP